MIIERQTPEGSFWDYIPEIPGVRVCDQLADGSTVIAVGLSKYQAKITCKMHNKHEQ